MNLLDIKNMNFFAKGHRGILYIGDYKGKKVVIKTKRRESKAIGRMENEAKFLRILNKKGIGPKLLFYDKKQDFFVYYYIDGEFFPLFLEKQKEKNRKTILKIIKGVFVQCFRIDRLRIDKEEMHHPYKHIIIENKTKRPVLVDFERARYTDKSKNVTQFCDYIISKVMVELLGKRKIKVDREGIIEAAKTYKKKQSYGNLKRILKEIG